MMLQYVKISLTSSGKKSWQPLNKEFHGTEYFFRSSSPSQEIPAFSETRVYHPAHNIPSSVPIKSQINPVYALLVYIFNMNMYFNSILQSTTRSSLVSFLYVSPPKFYVHFFFRPMDQLFSLHFPLLTSFQITCPGTHTKALSNFSQHADFSSGVEMLQFVCRD